jgi:AraC-like DNA-binding protein
MRDPARAPFRFAADGWLEPGHGIAVHDQVVEGPVRLHWHEFSELSYVAGGTGRHAVNGAAGTLRPGDVLALTPADFHELWPDAGRTLRIIDVVYADDVLPAELRQSLPAAGAVHLPGLADEFERMLAEGRRTDPAAALALRATLTRVLVDLVRAAEPGGRPPSSGGAPRPDVHRALVWIDHHFRDRVRLADAAAVARLSPHHFSGLFRRATGVSFQEYLVDRRLQFARGLLAGSDLPVTEVCHAAGFGDLTHFSRSYRRRFGHPPSSRRPRRR